MTLKTWAALAANELVAHSEVADAVANNQLAWKTSNPGITPSGYCYTRADFEAYIEHSSMSSSGIGTNEPMSKSEMETYRVLSPALTSAVEASDWVLFEATWEGWVVFGVNALTQSVKVERSVNGGPYSLVNNQNVSPGSSGNSTARVQVDTGMTLSFRLTPYSGSNATGTAGTPLIRDPVEPV